MTTRLLIQNLVLLCLGLPFLSGCANFLQPQTGAVARPEARIAIPEKGTAKNTFSTGDVKIDYSLSGLNEPFAFSGTLFFDRSLSNAFPVIARFSLMMSFLDDQGRVIETIDVTPLYGAYSEIPESMGLRVSRPAPPGSRAIAFNYSGEFFSPPREDGDEWDIFYFPYD